MTKSCQFPGCGKKHHAKGLCRFHYNRSPVLGTCSVEGCGKRVQARGLCAMHYVRRWEGKSLFNECDQFIRENPPKGGTGLVPIGRSRAASGPLQVAVVDAEDYPRVVAHHWYAGAPHPDGTLYPVAKIGDRKVRLSHFVLGLKGRREVNYWDKDPLNNRRSNLSVASRSQIMANQRVSTRPKSSRFKGVSRIKNTRRFEANVQCNQVKYHLGCFRDEAQAARAYDKKARELFGPFARLNFPDHPSP